MPGPDRHEVSDPVPNAAVTPQEVDGRVTPSAGHQANDQSETAPKEIVQGGPETDLLHGSTEQTKIKQGAAKKLPVLWRVDRGLEKWLAPILVGVVCLFVGSNSEHDQKLHLLENLERVVLAIVAAFATFNYQKTLDKLKRWTRERHAYLLNLLTAANALLFGLVIYFNKPTLRITGIVGIYAVFVTANVLQVCRSIKQCSDRKKQAALVLEAYTFLLQENAPTLVAYSLAVAVIAAAPLFLSVDETLIKVFTGGIATFHLGLSVIQYSIAILPNDPVEVVLDKSEWSEEAYQRVDRIPVSIKRWGGFLIVPVLVAAVMMVIDNWRLIVPYPSIVLRVPNLMPTPPKGVYKSEDR